MLNFTSVLVPGHVAMYQETGTPGMGWICLRVTGVHLTGGVKPKQLGGKWIADPQKKFTRFFVQSFFLCVAVARTGEPVMVRERACESSYLVFSSIFFSQLELTSLYSSLSPKLIRVTCLMGVNRLLTTRSPVFERERERKNNIITWVWIGRWRASSKLGHHSAALSQLSSQSTSPPCHHHRRGFSLPILHLAQVHWFWYKGTVLSKKKVNSAKEA